MIAIANRCHALFNRRCDGDTVRLLSAVLTLGPLLLACGLAGCAAQPTPAPSSTPTSPSTPGSAVTVLSDSTLPRIPLGQAGPVGTVGQAGPVGTDDHGVALGGIGSDIYPADAPDEFWMITDRGPNGQIKVDGTKRRTFPVPDFDPSILLVRADGRTLTVIRSIPITTPGGRGVTGLSNTPGHDETPYDLTATGQLPFNQSGLDTEGLVHTSDGGFWVSEEYSPSLLHLSATGTVLARYVPAGMSLPDAGYPVLPALPGILAHRQINRGFESLAISPDGRTLYAALQSPLGLPDPDAGGRSLAVRLIAFDIGSGRPTGEYVYPLEAVTGFDPGADGDQSEMKISAMAWYGPDELVVDERTDAVAKLYRVHLRGATNLLGGPFDDPAHRPALEQAGPGTVTPLAKTLLVDLTKSVRSLPKKIEGLAVLGPRTIAVANDNDFGMTDGAGAFGPDGRLRDSGVPSRLLLLRLP
jgi:hypothetical protein